MVYKFIDAKKVIKLIKFDCGRILNCIQTNAELGSSPQAEKGQYLKNKKFNRSYFFN